MELGGDTKAVLLAAALMFLWALLLGVMKYRQMAASEEGLAHPYTDTAHRAALLYSFAALVMMELVEYSPYSNAVQLWATAVPLLFFAAAIGSYVYHGIAGDTDNQFSERNFVSTWGMALLIAGEMGGVLVLFWGFVTAQVL